MVLFQALERQGLTCRLYCADPTAAAALGHMAEPIPPALIQIAPVDLIVCDSYRLPEADLEALRQRCRLLVALDDMAGRPLGRAQKR